MYEEMLPIALAPMAGVTDYAMRSLWRAYGAWPLFSEMVSAKAIVMGNKKTWGLFPKDDEQDVALQLFGSEPDVMAKAAAILKQEGYKWIDINMGCPVPKVAGHGEGSALFCDPLRAFQIVAAVAQQGLTVSVKMRIGFHEVDVPKAVAFAQGLEKAGARALAVHGRSRAQYYAGKADWQAIAEVVKGVQIPVLANGDVTDLASAQAILQQTGAKGMMIGRAARGNPWLFRTIRQGLKGEEAPLVSIKERKAVILEHAKRLEADKGAYVAYRELRKHIAWYTHGMHGAANLRRLGAELSSYDDLEAFLGALHA